MKTMTPTEKYVALLAAGMLGFAVLAAPSAGAAEQDSQEIELLVSVDGALVPVSEERQSEAMLDLEPPAPADPDTMSPQLIDLGQWFRCFELDMKDDEYAFYTSFWDGQGHDVRLKCGEQNLDTGNGWGYKHIEARHELNWQAVLDKARERGWNIGPIANGGSWDDLMAAMTGEAITYPGFTGGRATNQTRCVNSEFHFANVETGEIVYSFRVEAAFALDSDRLITSFPSSRTTC